ETNERASTRAARRRIIGTPAYMSPEQARGEAAHLDERTDVFGIGGVLYFLLTGRAPYSGYDYNGAMRRAAAGAFMPLEQSDAPEAPPALLAIARGALAADPADRYQSAFDLKRDLEAFIRGGFHLPMVRFAPGARIVVEGEPGDTAYVIQR